MLYEVLWSVDCEAPDTFLYASLTNVSALGIFVRTEAPMPVGTCMVLRFAPPSHEGFALQGVVQWINPVRSDGDNLNPGMGVRFVELAQGDRARLVEVVRTIAYTRDTIAYELN